MTSVGHIERISTVYHYDRPGSAPAVAAVGSWVRGGGFPFRIRYTAEFEHATADYDLGRDAPLMLSRDGAWTAVELPAVSGYEAEIRHVLDAVAAHTGVVLVVGDALADQAATFGAKAALYVYLGTHAVVAAAHAHYVLPLTTFAEQEGTFTNHENRVQRFWPALQAPGDRR